MYMPSLFKITDSDELHRIITDHSLGILVTAKDGLDANHIPFLLDTTQGEMGVLIAHVARANPICQDMNASDVLVIFRGMDSYISPNWYPSKHETHRHVPTWNYEVVHVHGKLSMTDDEKFARGVVGRLTKTHEASQPKAWKMSDAPADYIDKELKSIVGIQIVITKIEGKSKLSQNRDPRDKQGVIEALENKGDVSMAQAIKKHL